MKEKIIKVLKGTGAGLASAVKVLLSVCLMTGIFYGSYAYLSEVFEYSGQYDGSEFHNVPEDTMDIIVLGSSHSQYSFMPAYIYEDTGLYSYVLGTACQPFSVSYQMLREALKTQSPELVVMEIFTGTPLRSTCSGDSCYVTASYQMTGEEKYNTLNYLDKEKAETYYNPFINDHNNWKTMENWSDLLPEEKSTEYGSWFGYIDNYFSYAYNYWYPPVYSNDSLPEVELDSADLEALNNILTLCKENDMELMLYMVPCDGISETDQAYRYKIWDWAKENDVKYQDYVDKAAEIDFRMCVHTDGAHPFINGASLISDYMAEFISSNYDFDSHTENEDISKHMNSAIENYILSSVKSECNPKIFLKRLSYYDGTILVRFRVTREIYTSEMIELMKGIGCGEAFNLGNNYYAIIDNGQVAIDSTEPFSWVMENGQEFEIGKDYIVHFAEVIDYSNPFTVVVFKKDYSGYVVKNIESCTDRWRADGAEFWERGYDEYYSCLY